MKLRAANRKTVREIHQEIRAAQAQDVEKIVKWLQFQPALLFRPFFWVFFDHDIIDGAPAARFTERLKELIESGYGLPDSMIASEQAGAEAAAMKR